MEQIITLEVKVDSPNGLSQQDLDNIKGALQQTLYKNDEYTNILVHEEMGYPEDVEIYIY